MDFPKYNLAVLMVVFLFICGFAFDYWARWIEKTSDDIDDKTDKADKLRVVSASCFSGSALVVLMAMWFNWNESSRGSGRRFARSSGDYY